MALTMLIKKKHPFSEKKIKTGLPDQLKSGIENMSGYAMDDVRVHYNSSKPAQLQAHAYAQGTDIHLASGQEQHLPHEAWHVVQQKQGRVKPTMQLKGKVNVNDDGGLEREADVMGAKANNFVSKNESTTQRKRSDKLRQGVIQRVQTSITDVNSDAALDTPYTILRNELGPNIDLFMHNLYAYNSNPPAEKKSKYKRAKEVKAVIVGSGRPAGTRADPDGVSSAIGNFGNQELLLRHGIRQQTYEGGHLIGDQLLPHTNATNSMVDWNMAPQIIRFNSPAYARLIESRVAGNVIKEKKNPGEKNKVSNSIPINMHIKLGYPSNTFSVTVKTVDQEWRCCKVSN